MNTGAPAEGAEAEGDEIPSGRGQRGEDNALGRLLALSDGVFAIAMTLLVLDLRVPELRDGATNEQLVAALEQDTSRFATYLLSFYVVAGYWIFHHRIMRSVTTTHPQLIGHTLMLLLLVAALPFPSSLLAEHASLPVALAIYGGFNVVASLLLLLLRHDVQSHGLVSGPPDPDRWEEVGWQIRANVVVFALTTAAGFVLGSNGAWVLLLLVLSRRFARLGARARQRRRRAA